MSYTKGPWRITLLNSMGKLEKDCMPGVELAIATIEFHRGKETDKANARLLAAAPKLLEACEEVIELLTRINAIGNYGRRTKRKIEQLVEEVKEG